MSASPEKVLQEVAQEEKEAASKTKYNFGIKSFFSIIPPPSTAAKFLRIKKASDPDDEVEGNEEGTTPEFFNLSADARESGLEMLSAAKNDRALLGDDGFGVVEVIENPLLIQNSSNRQLKEAAEVGGNDLFMI